MNNSIPKRRVLVVDDDPDIRYAIVNILRRCDCDVVDAMSVEAAFDVLQSRDIDIIFCDMRFQGELGGEDLLAMTVENYPHIDVILVSCAMDGMKKAELQAKGAAHCLQKPFFKDTCLTVLANLDQPAQKAA